MDPHEEHEHPPVFFEQPIVHPRVIPAIRDVLRQRLTLGPANLEAAERPLDEWDRTFSELEWLADRARRMVGGDPDARRHFDIWIEERSAPAPDAEQPAADETAGDEPARAAGQPRAARVFNLAPVVDIFMGAAYSAGADAAALRRSTETVRAELTRAARFLDRLYAATLSYLSGMEIAGTFPVLLNSLRGTTPIPAQPAGLAPTAGDAGHPLPERNLRGFLQALDRLQEHWLGDNPVSVWLAAVSETTHNQRLNAVRPRKIHAGGRAVLSAIPATPFAATQPPSLVVRVGATAVEARVIIWSETEVTVEVPETSTSGYAWFGRTLRDADRREIQASLDRAAAVVGAAWRDTLLAVQPPQHFVAPPLVAAGARNGIEVVHRPAVLSFQALDGEGTATKKDGVRRGAFVRLHWAVSSDDDDVEVEILKDGRRAYTGLPPHGSLEVPSTRPGKFSLRAHNIVGDVIVDVDMMGFNNIRVFPSPVTLVALGVKVVTIQAPNVVPEDLEVTLTSSNPQKVTVWPGPIRIGAGQRETVAGIIAREQADNPSEPAAIIQVSAPGYWPSSLPVWVENRAGEWFLQEPALQLVAIHAALMPNGRVFFFSHDEQDYTDLHKGKYQVWDPETGAPAQLGLMDRNLFCAGHCFLPDGRLLVAGGKNGGGYYALVFGGPVIHEGPDRDVHTVSVDAGHPTGVNWERHRDLPQARWYPTCVTAANGLALMIAGSRHGADPADVYINQTIETFDYLGNIKGDPNAFGKNTKLYPFAQLLPDGSPGGTLFVYTEKKSWLYSVNAKSWVDRTFTTNGDVKRTYPHQGSCVLLPLLPPYTARPRVLVLGGSGSDATDSAEIFEFDRANPSASFWRFPSGGRMAHRRFMSDAVLLPDGTVFVVNGAGRGEATDSHEPVRVPDVFDPVTERWNSAGMMAPQSRERLYHSVAILLPDGRVLVSGNTRKWNPENDRDDMSIEVFSPPYLFRGPRPLISSVPARVRHGDDWVIRTPFARVEPMFPGTSEPNPSHVASVALVRAGSVTHSNNMDQRYVGVEIRERRADELVVSGPPDGTIAPPGYYMVFLITAIGVPSIARFVRVG